MPLFASVYMCLWSPAGKELTSWLSFVVSYCEFVTFPFLGQVWYMIVSIPDLCILTYLFAGSNIKLRYVGWCLMLVVGWAHHSPT